jgi:hypothetical protein
MVPGRDRSRRVLRCPHLILLGPRLAAIGVRGVGHTIRIRYSKVNGRLLPAQRVEGFGLQKKVSTKIWTIYMPRWTRRP